MLHVHRQAHTVLRPCRCCQDTDACSLQPYPISAATASKSNCRGYRRMSCCRCGWQSVSHCTHRLPSSSWTWRTLGQIWSVFILAILNLMFAITCHGQPIATACTFSNKQKIGALVMAKPVVALYAPPHGNMQAGQSISQFLKRTVCDAKGNTT